MSVTLDFYGAAGSVTGSCYRISHPKGRFLGDCGMFQGSKTLTALNYRPLPFDPREPAVRQHHRDAIRTGVDGVFDQLLQRAGGPFHHFTGGDAVDEMFGQTAY